MFYKKGHRLCMYTTYREKLEKHHKIILMLSIHVIHDILFIVGLLKVVYVALNMLFYYVTADNLMQYTLVTTIVLKYDVFHESSSIFR